MPRPFDPGYHDEPFRTLVQDYPAEEVYPPSQFRVEWGPIFHRGRLDGSARVLVIGQDPAQHETIVRRILVGEAGRRLQGFIAKLGITRSYVLINTYLYSVYGSVKSQVAKDPRLVGYRNRWLDALLVGKRVEAVLALGTAATDAWNAWKATPTGQGVNVPFAAVTHPTQPESSSKGDRTKLALATKTMLKNWNVGLETLAPGDPAPGRAPRARPLRRGLGRRRPAHDARGGLPRGSAALDAGRRLGEARRRGRPREAPQHHDQRPEGNPVVTIERKWFPLTGPVRPALRRGPAAEAKILVDPLAGPKLALAGRVVTMDDDFRVETDGVVYLELGNVVAVRPRAQPAPPGFEATSVLETGGTIFPGLIELHNHLSYNALPLWNVPKRYDHRGQWPNHPDYRKLISGPMTVIGELKNADGTLAAAARADPLRRVQVPARRGDDEPGREAREQRRHPALLPRARPQRRADRRQGSARGSGPHPRHRGQGRGLVPRTARRRRTAACCCTSPRA